MRRSMADIQPSNAQRDGRPAEYRWRPVFNAAKFGRRPLTRVPCSNEANTRNPLNFAVVPQTTGPISAASGPKFTILWGQCFFPIVDVCALIAKMQPDKVVRWCADGEFLASFWFLHFQQAACSTFQTCILNSH